MNTESEPVRTQKKRCRFFELYISKLLKLISEKNNITQNAKQQLNSALCIFSKIFSDKIRYLTKENGKKTISEKDVLNVIQIVFPEELSNYAVASGNTALVKYKESTSKSVAKSSVKESMSKNTRQEKAGISFPPSLLEKFLRDFGNSNLMVSDSAPVCLAAIVQYLTGEILELAVESASINNRVRITIRDLEMGIRHDDELNEFFVRNNMSFLGGGSVPYIHPSLIVKKPKKKNTKKKDKEEGPKKHRFRQGTVAIREIKKYQKCSNVLTMPKIPFKRLVRSIVNEEHTLKISKDVFTVLQYFIEQKVIDILRYSNLAAIHAGRVKMLPADIKFIRDAREKIVFKHDTVLSLDEEDN